MCAYLYTVFDFISFCTDRKIIFLRSVIIQWVPMYSIHVWPVFTNQQIKKNTTVREL